MIMLFQLNLFFALSAISLRIMRLMTMIVMLLLSIQMTSAVTTEEEIESSIRTLKLRRMNSDSSTTSLKSGRSPAQDLFVTTQSPKGVALEDNPNQKEVSPDSVAGLSLFDHFDDSASSSAAPSISQHVYERLFTAFQTTIDQHSMKISFDALCASYPDSVIMLSSFPEDKQLCMARFCLSFTHYSQMHDAALVELMHVLRPETLLGQFSDGYIAGMRFPNNQEACHALKETLRLSSLNEEALYEIYALAPALYHGGLYLCHSASLDDKLSVIDSFIHPHPHFELLRKWGGELVTLGCSMEHCATVSTRNSDYLHSLPTVDEYRYMAYDFGYLATFATSNMNKAMIKNWLVEHKATPILRHAIVEQAAILMNQPDFYVKKKNAALGLQSTNPLDFMLLDPMCQPTDILEALYQTTASRTDLREDAKIAMQWEVVRHVKAMKTAAENITDSAVAVRIKEISDKYVSDDI